MARKVCQFKDRAYYTPATDSIHLPPKPAFESAGEYYSTLFHELGHSTGHRLQLDSKLVITAANKGQKAADYILNKGQS